MKIRVLKRTSDELKIEVEGAGHSLCNLLQKRLLEDGATDLAGYDVPHPLASNPLIYIRTKEGAKPEAVLRRAAEEARDLNRTFGKELQRALKKT